MTRTVITGAAIILLTSASAFAQIEAPMPGNVQDPAAPDPGASPQAIEIPPPPPVEPGFDAPMRAEDDEAGGDDRPGEDRGWRRHRTGDNERHHGGRGMGYHGPRHHAWEHFREHHSRGARFTFSQGDGSPSIVIKCADGDSTLECANAVMPMLDRVLPPRPAETATP